MGRSFIELIVGSLHEKSDYRRLMKRVKVLPDDYRFAFKNMQRYLYYSDLADCGTLFSDLAELLEAGAAQGKPVLDIIGSDVAGFCDALVSASAPDALTPRAKLNRDIHEHFHSGGE